jgi:hypothetical protein
MKTQTDYFSISMFYGATAIVALVLSGVLMSLLVSASDANKARKATETTELVCLEGDHIAKGDSFTECRRVTWRPA